MLVRLLLLVAGVLTLAAACNLDAEHGPPAAGIEIVAAKDFYGQEIPEGGEIFLHEIPSATGFLEAYHSRLYRSALPSVSVGHEQYGAVELIGSIPVGWPAYQYPAPLTGGYYGEISIPRLGNLLYEDLWWMLIAGTTYPAVVFTPIPSQPTPPAGQLVTTFLAVCHTDEVTAANCRSWPGAVQHGMVVCRDEYTKVPISKAKCSVLAPHTVWHVKGTPPPVPRPVEGLAVPGEMGYPEGMAIDQAMLSFLQDDAAAARAAIEAEEGVNLDALHAQLVEDARARPASSPDKIVEFEATPAPAASSSR